MWGLGLPDGGGGGAYGERLCCAHAGVRSGANASSVCFSLPRNDEIERAFIASPSFHVMKHISKYPDKCTHTTVAPKMEFCVSSGGSSPNDPTWLISDQQSREGICTLFFSGEVMVLAG